MSAKERGHRTQWAAQFAVASELCKREYEVSFTMGNTAPVADLMVVSPISRQMFLVEVKGLYRENSWVIKRKIACANLFYILAYVPNDAPNEFFIMTQKQVNRLIATEVKRLRRRSNYPITGFVWKLAQAHKGDWGILPK